MNPLEFTTWYPKGIRHLISAGASNYVALYEDDLVLKYPLVPPNDNGPYDDKGKRFRASFRASAVRGLEVEEKILRALGEHPRIVRLHQAHEDGLLLEYVPNGTVGEYLRDTAPETSLQQRLKWARQAAEAVAYIHSRNVLHCDISVGNLLLDANLDIKLIDFQGRLLSPDGTVLRDGGAANGAMSAMPRLDEDYCDFRTDIFALGTSMFYIITGHLPFTDVNPVEDEEEIQRRFREGELPPLEWHCGGDVIRKCWRGNYKSAQEIVVDLQDLEEKCQREKDAAAGAVLPA